jgi:hypothetical protein
MLMMRFMIFGRRRDDQRIRLRICPDRGGCDRRLVLHRRRRVPRQQQVHSPV